MRWPRGCEVGEAKLTPGFDLSFKAIVHAVGPIWKGGTSGEAELLANAYRNSLAAAADHDVKSIVFPAISTGVFSYPLQEAADIAVHTIADGLSTFTDVDKVTFACIDHKTEAVFLNAIASLT